MTTHFDLGLIRRYNVPGPRYTSYPTALQFGPFSEDDLERAIHYSPHRRDDLSLYVHLPFCATLCYYCACNKVVTRKQEPLARYLADLETEIHLQAPSFTGRRVSQLHWGGGTPTYLNDEQIETLYGQLTSAFNFCPDDEGEFSIEIDPRTVDAARVAKLRSTGFNRLSLGIQDFNPDVQAAVNRHQTFDDTRSIIQAARNSGFRSISVDLIYGLPKQSKESFSETLDLVNQLRPDRISIYNYAHLPDRFHPQRRILEEDLPTPEARLRILELCSNRLEEAGYVYIGMDHFALPDDELAQSLTDRTLQRNFQGYSTHADTDMLALGVTAISHIGNTYAQNAKDLDSYHEALAAQKLPIKQGVVIDEDDQIRKRVIRDMMCHFDLQFDEINQEFGISFRHYFDQELEQLQVMAADHLIEISDRQIRVTERGRFLIRNICMVFDRYISGSPVNRYSRAI